MVDKSEQKLFTAVYFKSKLMLQRKHPHWGIFVRGARKNVECEIFERLVVKIFQYITEK